MKTIKILLIAGVVVSLAACKSNPNTTANDSTGTGAGGARVPGMVSRDTSPKDTAKTAATDSVKKQ